MLAADIEARIVRQSGGCWIWTGRVGSAGYPQRGKVYINRLAYEDAYGPINPGWRLFRSCPSVRCVSPEHRTASPIRDTAFWSFVDQSGGPDACWPWTGKVKDTGYAFVVVDGRANYGHRRAYELAKGPIPPGMLVMHSCDNRRCCNPAHLESGDFTANNRDAVAKGRHFSPFRPSGPEWRHCNARLTPDDVREIRRLASEGGSRHALAQTYGIKYGTVNSIVQRRSWRHVA